MAFLALRAFKAPKTLFFSVIEASNNSALEVFAPSQFTDKNS